jgi:putative nucleotidyltransferase with HDIG domain
MGMTAKILQIANSAMYGQRAEISEPGQAVMLLGLNTIQAMVLSLSVFSAFDSSVIDAQEVQQLWDHSVSTSRFSKAIAQSEGIAGHALDPYLSAGLLHDIGKLVMASGDPEAYRRILNVTASTETNLWLVEKQDLGCSHAEIGAYLLGIWGLPASIIEAVAWHHYPSDSPVTDFSPVTAVHTASAFHAQLHPEFRHGDPDLDQAFLERIGLAERQKIWMELCNELNSQDRQ